MHKALVIGSDERIGLSVIRSLGRAGIEVHVGWHQPHPLTARSRYIAKAHLLPAYRKGDRRWAQAVCQLMQQEKFDLVLPCTEAETIACHQERAELERYGKVYLLNSEAFRILFDKMATTELARSVGVRTPREAVVTCLEQAQAVLPGFRFPVVLKPHRSINPDEPGPFQVVRKAYSEAEFASLIEPMLQLGPVVLQENFIGVGVGVELLLQEGEPLLCFQHERVHEPMQGGPSSYRKSVPVTPALLEASLRLFRALNYTGVAMAEFKVHPSGDWVFLEVNARFWGSLPLAVAAGANFPYALFQLLVGGQVTVPRHYRLGIHSRNWSLDLDWWQANWKADPIDPTLASRPVARVLKDLFWNLLTFRERSDTLVLDDPGPGIGELLELGRRAAGKLARKLGWKRRKPMSQG